MPTITYTVRKISYPFMIKYKPALENTLNNFKKTLPILFGIILLISFIVNIIPSSFYGKIFTGNIISDSFLGAIFGSILAGNPINSYVIGIELLENGVGLIAITAFIISWVTVGIVQLPAEAMLLGKKFAIMRNIFSFISAIIIAIITVLILQIL